MSLRLFNNVETLKVMGTFDLGLNTFCIMIWSQACGESRDRMLQFIREMLPHRCIYLSTCSPDGRSVWGSLWNL